MSYQKIHSSDGDSQDVELFEAVSMSCVDCGEETIVRASGTMIDRMDASSHQKNCMGEAKDSCLFNAVPVDWAFAFGSEGCAWDEPCEFYNFSSEASALWAAMDYFEGTLNA